MIRAATTPGTSAGVAARAASAPLWVKICGLRTREAVESAVQAGANAVGFVFHAGSPRNLDVAAACELSRGVPAGVERVAVFLHPAQSLVDEVLAAVAPDWVQTDVEDLAGLALPAGQRVLPVLRSGDASAGAPSATTSRAPGGVRLPARCLFESGKSGAGERADWLEAARLARATQLVLAGGLDPGNVADAIRTVRPFGVDVSSGVERERGVKDAALIREFIRAAREAVPAPCSEESR